jgi:transcriptional regulator with XRE-family HTH domain
MVRWNAGTEHVKTQRLIDSVHLTLAPVLLGQGEPLLHGLDLHALNQTQLAARAGMNASKISRIETSTRNVTLSTLARLAHALNRRVKIEFVPVKAKKPATGVAHKRAALTR